MPGNGIFFASYEAMAKAFSANSDSEQEPGIVASVFAGGLAGMVYWIWGMPSDVLKSRLQTAPDGTYKHGIRDVFKELMKIEGPTALYRGVSPVMLRAFPANAACFFGIGLANMCFKMVAPNF